MSNLSELLPAGAGAKSAKFVASGTLASGQTVGLKTDGTVEAISLTAVSDAMGTASEFSAGNYISAIGMCYDLGNDRVIISYRNEQNSSYGTIVAGTVSGQSISFGTPYVFNSTGTYDTQVVYDIVAAKILCVFGQNAAVLYGVALTLSSGSWTQGSTASKGASGNVGYVKAAYDVNAQKTLAVFKETYIGLKGAIVSLSGATVTIGNLTAVSGFNQNSEPQAITYDDSTGTPACVIVADTDSGGNQVKVFAGYIYGLSTPTFGSPTQVATSSVSRQFEMAIAYDSVQKKSVIIYRHEDGGVSDTYAVVATIAYSSLAMTLGTPVAASNLKFTYPAAIYDTYAKRTVLCFNVNQSPQGGATRTITISGTTPTWSTTDVYYDSGGNSALYNAVTYDPDTLKVIPGWASLNVGQRGFAAVYQVGWSTTNYTSFVGITDEIISSGASGSVIVQGGVNSKVTSLTIASDYYVQTNGTISTASSTVPAGRALSTSSILLEG